MSKFEENGTDHGHGSAKKKEGVGFLETGNRILIIVIAGFLGYGLIRYFSEDQRTVVSWPDQGIVSNASSTPALGLVEPKPLGVYEEAILARDLFQPFDYVQADTKALEKALPALHQRIKVIGILLDKDSKAIVEDLNDQQTHFLSKGESIGTARLEDIKEDKVIFMYNNERVEMSP